MQKDDRIVFRQTVNIFQKLGWDVSEHEKIISIEEYNIFSDISLRYKGKLYGYVEVLTKNDIEINPKKYIFLLNDYLKKHKPLVFIITNGYKYDVYHYGEFYGSLTIPPSPKNVNTLFGGELNE